MSHVSPPPLKKYKQKTKKLTVYNSWSSKLEPKNTFRSLYFIFILLGHFTIFLVYPYTFIFDIIKYLIELTDFINILVI